MQKYFEKIKTLQTPGRNQQYFGLFISKCATSSTSNLHINKGTKYKAHSTVS